MLSKRIGLIAILTACAISLHAQAPIQWQHSYGGSENDYALSLMDALDDGYLIIGITNSGDGDVQGHNGGEDLWLVKLDQNGELIWQRALGTVYNDRGTKMTTSYDGGYLLCGSSNMVSPENNGGYDVWLVGADINGAMLWERSYGGSESDHGIDVIRTSDQGYAVLANSSSTNGDVSNNNGETDIWLIKLTAAGEIEWQKNFGGSAVDSGVRLHQLSDGGYIIGANTLSNDGDVTGQHGNRDNWLIRLDQTGELIWEQAFGGSIDDILTDIDPVDGGFIISGYTSSLDGDVSENTGFDDVWLYMVNDAGELQWDRSYGGANVDHSHDLQVSQNGFILAGLSNSYDGDVSGLNGLSDWWILELDPSGEILWEDCIGGTDAEVGRAILQTSDGGHLITGYTRSNDVDASENQGMHDYWVVKLDPVEISIDESQMLQDVLLYPNPSFGEIFLQFKDPMSRDPDIALYDSMGHKIKSFNHIDNSDLDLIRINFSEMPPGCYSISLRSKRSTRTIPFIIM